MSEVNDRLVENDGPACFKPALPSRQLSDQERISSSRPASEGCAGSHSAELTSDSVCAQQIVGPSPFTTRCSQGFSVHPSTPSKSKLNVRFSDPHLDSGCDDTLLSRPPLAQYATPARTKSCWMAEIADEVSRNSQSVPRHARKSSADSQDQHARSRKRNRCYLLKAASAPEDFGTDLPTFPWVTSSPCESQNWADCSYQRMEPGNERKFGRAEAGGAKGRNSSRKRYAGRHRTSRFIGVGSSNRKTQWQARILVEGKVTHLGYYRTEMEAASIYDRIALTLNPTAQTNFPASSYHNGGLEAFSGLGREDLQRALGVKPMDKSSKFRGVSRKKGKWEAKVMVNRKWAYRALFDSEAEAAHAYDAAVWRLKPNEATSFVNFKDGVSTRDSAAKSPKKELVRSLSVPSTRPVVKVEDEAEPEPQQSGRPSSVTLADEHLFASEESPEEQSLPRSQTVPLPQEEFSGHTSGSFHQLPPVRTLHHAASFPSMEGPSWLQMSMASHSSSMACPSPMKLSPRRSVCSDQLPPVLPVAVPVLPHVELPDPNSIGVPPPANLPYPELLAGGIPSSVISTPLRMPASPFPGPQIQSPSRAASASGLPPLPRNSSMLEQEAPVSFLTGSMSQLSTAMTLPCLDSHNDASNPFYHASLPRVSTQPDLRGLASLPLASYSSQSGLVSSVEDASAAFSGPVQGNLSGRSRQQSYSTSMAETLMPMGLPHLSAHASIDSIQSVHYASSPAGLTQPMGDMYAGVTLPQVDSPMSMETRRNMPNSRSASSNNFLHSAASSSRLPTSSTNSGMPMFTGTDLSSIRHDSAPTMSKLHLPLEANYFSQADLLHATSSGSAEPIADSRRLNYEQADLLENLDVDVEMNEPIPLNPVHIGGEDMNVYSPHIVGDCQNSSYSENLY